MAWSDLIHAAISGEFDKKEFDANHRELNRLTDQNASLLHFSIVGGNLDTIRYLLERNLNVNAKNLYGETPLHWCCKEGNVEIARLLLSYGAKDNARDYDGNSPLHWAAEYNQHEIVSELLSRGVPCNKVNKCNETPMQVAIINTSGECVSLLNKKLTNNPERSSKLLSLSQPNVNLPLPTNGSLKKSR